MHLEQEAGQSRSCCLGTVMLCLSLPRTKQGWWCMILIYEESKRCLTALFSSQLYISLLTTVCTDCKFPGY